MQVGSSLSRKKEINNFFSLPGAKPMSVSELTDYPSFGFLFCFCVSLFEKEGTWEKHEEGINTWKRKAKGRKINS
jgi:hypothetical protein